MSVSYSCPKCGSDISMRVLYAKEVSCPTCRASLSAIPVGGLAGIPAGGLIYMGIEGNQLALAVGLCGFAVTFALIAMFPGIKVIGQGENT